MASKIDFQELGLPSPSHKNDGMLKHKNTYEIISPEDIGLIRSNESGIVLGKLSGRHALKAKKLELGYDIDGKELDGLFACFKAVAGNKKCKVCMQTFMCTTSEVKCKEHAEAKHPKADLYTCFPNLKK